MKKKTIDVHDLFTDAEIEQARNIIGDGVDISTRLRAEIIAPALARINADTKQENSATNLAYVLEWTARYSNPRTRNSIGLHALIELRAPHAWPAHDLRPKPKVVRPQKKEVYLEVDIEPTIDCPPEVVVA